MTARGCAYAGSKGVVWGPIKDMVMSLMARLAVVSTHVPVGVIIMSAARREYVCDDEFHL